MPGLTDQGRISSVEGALLVVATILPWAVLFMPFLGIEQAGHDAWLSALPLTLFGLGLVYLVAAVGHRFPRRTIVGIACQVLGKPAGLVVGAAYGWWFLSVGALTAREFGELIISVILPRTPMPVVLGSILLVAALNVRSGIEVMARSNLLLAPFVIAFMTVLAVFSLRDLRAANWQPVLENGLLPVLKGAYVAAGFFGTPVVALSTVFPYLNRPAQATRALAWATAAVGWLTMTSAFWFVGVMGADLAARLRFLPVELARFISVAEFLERMEALTVAFWVLATFAKLSIWYYAAVTSLAEVLGLEDYRPLVWPVGILIAEFSIQFFRNVTDFVSFLRYAATPYMLMFELAIPALLLAVAWVRGLRGTATPPAGANSTSTSTQV